MGWHLDGRVTAVLGTHTHVPTADARVLPGGTAYITDVGMTGARGGVLGVKRELAVEALSRRCRSASCPPTRTLAERRARHRQRSAARRRDRADPARGRAPAQPAGSRLRDAPSAAPSRRAARREPPLAAPLAGAPAARPRSSAPPSSATAAGAEEPRDVEVEPVGDAELDGDQDRGGAGAPARRGRRGAAANARATRERDGEQLDGRLLAAECRRRGPRSRTARCGRPGRRRCG